MKSTILLSSCTLAGTAILIGQLSALAVPDAGDDASQPVREFEFEGGGGDQGDGGIAGTIGPDVIVSRVGEPSNDYHYYATNGGIATFSAATTSCNKGDVLAEWFSGSSGRHPLISQNLYRIDAQGDFEQIGMSWLKHSFCAVDEFTCPFGPCQPNSNCSWLAIGCADTYWATLNGDGLGPRSGVNPQGMLPGGTHNHPFSGASSPHFGRLAVNSTDLGNAGATYMIEAHYVTHDEDPEERHNNASWRQVNANPTSMTSAGALNLEQTALQGWKLYNSNASVNDVNVPGDGRFYAGAAVSDNGDGTWHYAYAVHNLNSDRSGQSFSVFVPECVEISNVGFHAPFYHSGEPFSGAAWGWQRSGTTMKWETETEAQNVNANAIRWGTTYSYEFDANTGPAPLGNPDGEIGLFKSGTPGSVTFRIPRPDDDCPPVDCPGDTDGDNMIGTTDLLALLAAWGTNDPDFDFDMSGSVDTVDLLDMLGRWGACT